jgi:arsenite methyltransferase
VQKDKTIIVPEEILKDYFSEQEITAFKNSGTRIASITVYGEKPAKDERNCCTPGSGCC